MMISEVWSPFNRDHSPGGDLIPLGSAIYSSGAAWWGDRGETI
jgi:hypothetical protein